MFCLLFKKLVSSNPNKQAQQVKIANLLPRDRSRIAQSCPTCLPSFLAMDWVVHHLLTPGWVEAS